MLFAATRYNVSTIPCLPVPSHRFRTADVGNSVSAIAFFEGRLYAADYSKTCLWYFEADSSGSPDMTKPRIIAEGVGANFVDLVRYCNRNIQFDIEI